MAATKLNILDVTVRQGGFSVHNHVLREQAADIAKGLEEAGIEFMELSHGRGIGAKRAGYPGLFSDAELLKAAKKAAPKLGFVAYVSPYAYSIFELEGVAEYCDWFRLSIDLDDLSKAADNLGAIQKTGVKAMAILERAHRLAPEKVAAAVKTLEAAGAQVFTLADTFGSMGSEEVKNYLGAIRSQTKLPLGFQGFNSTGQAIGNSLAAIESGAEWIDASLLGMGPSGGMASIEILAALLPQLGLGPKLDYLQLCRTGRWHALPALRQLPMLRRGDLLMSKYKLDYYPLEFLDRLAGILEMDLEDLIREIDAQKPERLRLKEIDIREFLAGHQLDFDVVVEFIKSGRVPDVEAAS